MPNEIALSTMWAIGQFPTLDQFFEAGNRLGFSRFDYERIVGRVQAEMHMGSRQQYQGSRAAASSSSCVERFLKHFPLVG